MNNKKLISFFIAINYFYCCRQIETLTPSRHFYLSISKSTMSDSINVDVIAGRVKIVGVGNDGSIMYDVFLSGVRGGYSEFLGNHFNIHDGLTSKRIQIVKNGLFYKNLSYNDILLLSSNKVDSIDTYNLRL